MIKIPKHIRSLKTYVSGKPAGLGASEQLIYLSSNENNVGASPDVVKALRIAAENAHQYPDPFGTELKSSIAQRLGKDVSNILLSNGLDGLLSMIFSTFFSIGDEVISSEGTFSSIETKTSLNQLTITKVPLTSSFEFDLDAMFQHISPKTKAIYLCSPNNPTGTIISQDSLKEFVSKIPSDILIIADEAYFEYGNSLSDQYGDSLRMDADNVLTLRTFSKAYGLAGLRLGYAIGPEYLVEALHKTKLTFNPNSMALVGGLAAWTDELHLKKCLDINRQVLAKYEELFKHADCQVVQSYANFIMLVFDDSIQARQFIEFFKARGILLRYLASFGMPKAVRVSTGNLQEFEHFQYVFADYQQSHVQDLACY